MLKCSVVDRQVVHEEVPNGQAGAGEVLPMQLKVDCRALDVVDVATAKEVEKTGFGQRHQGLDHPQQAQQPRLVSASASRLCLSTSSCSSVRRLNSGFALLVRIYANSDRYYSQFFNFRKTSCLLAHLSFDSAKLHFST
jgi:hypothetical protein